MPPPLRRLQRDAVFAIFFSLAAPGYFRRHTRYATLFSLRHADYAAISLLYAPLLAATPIFRFDAIYICFAAIAADYAAYAAGFADATTRATRHVFHAAAAVTLLLRHATVTAFIAFSALLRYYVSVRDAVAA